MSHPICFVFFASLIRFLSLRILVGFRRSSLVGPHRIASVSKELKKFFFSIFSYQICFVFFASLIRFLCFRIAVGVRRSSLAGPHRIPSAMLFEKHVLILLSGRWTFGTTRTTTSLQSPFFVHLQYALLQAMLLCTLSTFWFAIHATCKLTMMTRRFCSAQHRFCRSIHVSQTPLGFHPGASCLLRH